MKESIKDLIIAVAAGDAVQSEELFNNIMNAKAEEQLNDWQVNIAQTMFNPVSEDAEFESLEDLSEDVEEITEEEAAELSEDAMADFLAKGGKIKTGKTPKSAKFDSMNKDVTKRMGAKLS